MICNSQLVRSLNQRRLDAGYEVAQVILKYDLDMERTLAREDLSWRSVPADGQRIVVEGNALFDFTKRIIRRYPINMGLASYHVTDRVEHVRELSLKLFRHVGLQGLANAEFKYDERDGQLKLMECNARFTAGNSLVARAGFDLGNFCLQPHRRHLTAAANRLPNRFATVGPVNGLASVLGA